MRLPDWLDIALEGGALELQRALVGYRGLRRTLSGDWRRRAGQVAEQCAALAREEAHVERALERALRRARHDPHAGAAAHLAIAVERERRRIAVALAHECGEEARLPELLAHFEDTARDESYLESAWRRFSVERIVWTVCLAGAAAALPLGSWWSASHGGFVPVLFDVNSIVEVPVVPIGIAAVLAVCRLRVGSWSWLGLQAPPLSSAAGVSVCVSTGLVGVVASVAGNVPLSALVVGVLAIFALTLVRSLWRLARAPLLAPLR